MDNKNKKCFIAGVEANKFPWDYDNDTMRQEYLSELNKIIIWLLKNRYNYFITTKQGGVNADVVKLLSEAKDYYSDIEIVINDTMSYKEAVDSVDVVYVFWNFDCKDKVYRIKNYAKKQGKKIYVTYLREMIEELKRLHFIRKRYPNV